MVFQSIAIYKYKEASDVKTYETYVEASLGHVTYCPFGLCVLDGGTHGSYKLEPRGPIRPPDMHAASVLG